MNLTDELKKLAELHASGVLTEDEFQQAKKKLLETPPEAFGEGGFHLRKGSPGALLFQGKGDDSVGKAANRYVNFQIITAIIGFSIFLIFGLSMCSQMRPSGPSFGPPVHRFGP